jgi:hypothetical protein
MKKQIPQIIFVVTIAIIALLFHYEIHIENAVTETAEPAYGIAISAGRIIFEPFVGPLLFALRTQQPLEEFLITMVWIMILLLPTMLILGRTKSIPFKKSILKWFAALPIVLVAWIALFLVLLFAPLPANKISNQNQDIILLNIHSHTHWSHDGWLSHKQLAKWHQKNGFDAFFITEHNNHNKTLQAVEQQKQGNYAQAPLMMAGEEYSGSNHILLLGLKRDFRTKDMADSTAIDSAQANNGVAIIPHWFADEKKSIQHYINQGADGFEIANQGEGLTFNREIFRQIVEKCEQNNLLVMGSCDYHGYGSAAFCWNALDIPGWRIKSYDEKRAAIMNILRNHDQDKITVLLYRDRWIFPTSLIALSPLFNTISYFRSLAPLQLLSWIIWIVIVTILLKSIRGDFFLGLKCWAEIGMIAASGVLTSGIYMLSKVKALRGYNEIYAEYGEIFSWVGALFFIYSIVIYFYQLWKVNTK